MIFTIGAGVVAVVAAGYLGRKGWHAFHRAVGITPGTMVYKPPHQLPPPVLVKLSLDDTHLRHLPPVFIEHLVRIDQKVTRYQSLQQQLTQSGQTPVVTEDGFILSKLLTTRLPEILDNYQRIAVHEYAHSVGNHQPIQPPSNLQKALDLLHNLLIQIESKLDSQLQAYQLNVLQDMEAMSRYLEDR